MATRQETIADLGRMREGARWCLFIDRDGVINRRIIGGYVCSWDQFEFLPGAIAALGVLSRWAPSVVVITNQQGVGKGLMTAEQLAGIHDQMISVLEAEDVGIDAVLACPHLVKSGCNCRKPAPGLALDWLGSHPSVDGSLSVMVGDSDGDMRMGQALSSVTGGCATIGIGSGLGSDAITDATYESLSEFAESIKKMMGASERWPLSVDEHH